MSYLIQVAKIDPNSSDKTNTTLLFYSARSNQIEILKYFIEITGANPNQPDDNSWTPLIASA